MTSASHTLLDPETNDVSHTLLEDILAILVGTLLARFAGIPWLAGIALGVAAGQELRDQPPGGALRAREGLDRNLGIGLDADRSLWQRYMGV